jgi:hypothetical protein
MLQEVRPPYVRFEIRQKEDRTASIEAGRLVMRDVIYVLVTQIGSSDTYNNVAEDWLALMRSEASAEPPRVPMQWVRHWEEMYEAFKKSFSNEVEGTPLRSWPMILPDQLDACIRISCFTVEDLAVLTEEGIGRLGMGGRELKRKAEAWMQSATDHGKLANSVVAMEEQLKSLRERNESLEAQIKLLAEAAAPAPAKKASISSMS